MLSLQFSIHGYLRELALREGLCGLCHGEGVLGEGVLGEGLLVGILAGLAVQHCLRERRLPRTLRGRGLCGGAYCGNIHVVIKANEDHPT